MGGLAAGWLVQGPPVPRVNGSPQTAAAGSRVGKLVQRRRAWGSALWFGGLGMLPDADFLLGSHSTMTHSVGATLVSGALVFACARTDRLRLALASAAAYGTHVLLDWLGNDTSTPVGIMALWPFSSAFYQSQLHVFEAISRRWWLEGFWAHNLRAVSLEIALLLPVLAVVVWSRGARRRNSLAVPDAPSGQYR